MAADDRPSSEGQLDNADHRHPLPYSLQDGWITLEAQARGDEDRPYAIRLGRHDGTMAGLGADELRQLRDRIDQVLSAPFRVIPVGGTDFGYDDPRLDAAVRERLDRLRERHPHMEIATQSEPTAAGRVAERWAASAQVPTVRFRDVESAMAAGGNRVVLVAGSDGPDLASLAYQASIGIDLVRIAV